MSEYSYDPFTFLRPRVVSWSTLLLAGSAAQCHCPSLSWGKDGAPVNRRHAHQPHKQALVACHRPQATHNSNTPVNGACKCRQAIELANGSPKQRLAKILIDIRQNQLDWSGPAISGLSARTPYIKRTFSGIVWDSRDHCLGQFSYSWPSNSHWFSSQALNEKAIHSAKQQIPHHLGGPWRSIWLSQDISGRIFT